MARSELASNAMLNLADECFLIDILSMEMAVLFRNAASSLPGFLA
jgi:hypothetical protein